MAITHLGIDGYLKIQAEETWGTAVTDSMTDFPYMEGATAITHIAQVERQNAFKSRLLQKPSLGRKMAGLEVPFELNPALVGQVLNLFLGAASSTGTGAITHTFSIPLTGERVGKSFTAQFAQGADLADQITGCVITGLTIDGDSEGNVKASIKCVAKNYTRGVSRSDSISIPTAIPFSFSHLTATFTPAGESAITQPLNSYTLEIDLNYLSERFKAGVGGNVIENPIFAGRPTITFKCNIDAEKRFLNWANDDHKLFKIVLNFVSTENASGSTKRRLQFEMPGCMINPEAAISAKMENADLDLEFNCGIGGDATTTSDTMLEAIVVDTVATYT